MTPVMSKMNLINVHFWTYLEPVGGVREETDDMYSVHHNMA